MSSDHFQGRGSAHFRWRTCAWDHLPFRRHSVERKLCNMGLVMHLAPRWRPSLLCCWAGVLLHTVLLLLNTTVFVHQAFLSSCVWTVEFSAQRKVSRRKWALQIHFQKKLIIEVWNLRIFPVDSVYGIIRSAHINLQSSQIILNGRILIRQNRTTK